METILQYKLCFIRIRGILFMLLTFLFVTNSYADIPLDIIYYKKYSNDSINVRRNIFLSPKKNFLRATGEVIGMNIGLWAFDIYALKGHYAYISFETIKENFKHGFEWDNDHLNTNMFAHPYNGSLFFNAGRSNGFNFWQSELFAIGGSAMWELFMECEYPSTNDIIATPIGGAALGEVFYRTSDMILDDRSSGCERVGREFASFLISPMRGVTRLITGQAWKKSSASGKEYSNIPFDLNLSFGSRILFYHDDDNITKIGASARINLEYGDPFDGDSKIPYEYFSSFAEFNIMQSQPLLSRIEIIGRLFSKEFISTKTCDLSVGLYQHFDFFDSDTISKHLPTVLEPCVVPYKLGTPASIGLGSMFSYHNRDVKLNMFAHLNGILLGGILSDYYRYYNRNYNWASGFSLKLGVDGCFLHEKLSFSVKNQFYRLYTISTWGSNVDWSETPGGKPVNVQGDDSVGAFYHFEGQLNYRVFKQLSFSTRFDLYSRSTRYRGGLSYENVYASDWFIDSKQMSAQLLLTYSF